MENLGIDARQTKDLPPSAFSWLPGITKRVRRRTIVRWLFIVMFVWAALATIPMPPRPPAGTGLDASWAHALNLAHARHLIFGTDVVFTYGPLGYLLYPLPQFVPALQASALGWVVYATFLSGLFLLWRALPDRAVAVAASGALSWAILLTDLPYERLYIAFFSLLIAFFGRFVATGQMEVVPIAIAGAAAGAIPLFKTNEGASSCAVFYAVLVTIFLTGYRGRRSNLAIGVAAVAPIVGFAAGYVCVEHSVSGIWLYIVRSAQVALGYSEAMAFPGRVEQSALGILTLLALAVIVPWCSTGRRDVLRGYLPAMAAAFFAFKSGVVRQDDVHSDLLQAKLAVAAILLLVAAEHARDRRLLTLFIFASLCFATVVYSRDFPVEYRIAVHRALLRPEALRGTMWDGSYTNFLENWNFRNTWSLRGGYIRKELDTFVVDPAVSARLGQGTVDVVPTELDFITANGWRWKPRPVFQSYSAYTPALDRLNADHLASAASADHILMQWGDIDGRQPLLDDAASWRALFDHYDIDIMRPGFFLLKKRQSPRYLEPRPIGAVTAAWNRDIPVPRIGGAEFVMMRASVPKNAWGILRGILFRNSPAFLVASHASGKTSRWRVTRANLVGGAFIDVLPENLTETLPYFGGPPQSQIDRVESIRFETPGLLEFSSALHIACYSANLNDGEAYQVKQVREIIVRYKLAGEDE